MERVRMCVRKGREKRIEEEDVERRRKDGYFNEG